MQLQSKITRRNLESNRGSLGDFLDLVEFFFWCAVGVGLVLLACAFWYPLFKYSVIYWMGA